MTYIQPKMDTVIDVVPGTITVGRNSMRELAQRFSADGSLPLLQNDDNHDYFTLYRVKTSFEITDESHPIYQAKPFVRPELVAQLDVPQSAQIAFDAMLKKMVPFPLRDVSNSRLRNLNEYHIILPEEDYGREDYVHHLIIGDDVRKQLDLWGITPEKIRETGIERLL